MMWDLIVLGFSVEDQSGSFHILKIVYGFSTNIETKKIKKNISKLDDNLLCIATY